MKTKYYIAALLLAVGAMASADTLEEMQEWVQVNQDTGFRQAYTNDQDAHGFLGNWEAKEHYFSVIKGKTYKFAGVCDNDCSDVDIEVYNNKGELVAEDTEVDDIPLVSFVAEYTGRYRVEVTMADCSVEPCEYRVRGFRD